MVTGLNKCWLDTLVNLITETMVPITNNKVVHSVRRDTFS